MNSQCPICDEVIYFSKTLMLSERVICSFCASALEVIANNQAIEFAVAPEVAEDWGE